jgi:hypothetical protein
MSGGAEAKSVGEIMAAIISGRTLSAHEATDPPCSLATAHAARGTHRAPAVWFGKTRLIDNGGFESEAANSKE